MTACFSHEGTGHILLNAMSFYFMAPPVLAMLGNTAFLALYLGGGIVSSVTSVAFNTFVHKRHSASHGASGENISNISALSYPLTAEFNIVREYLQRYYLFRVRFPTDDFPLVLRHSCPCVGMRLGNICLGFGECIVHQGQSVLCYPFGAFLTCLRCGLGWHN